MTNMSDRERVSKVIGCKNHGDECQEVIEITKLLSTVRAEQIEIDARIAENPDSENGTHFRCGEIIARDIRTQGKSDV